MDESLATLQRALLELATTDVTLLSDGEVHRNLIEVTAALSSLQAVQFKLAGAWTRRGIWREDGSRSAGARLARECRLRRGTAYNVVRRAAALASMPATFDALEEGAITVDHVDALAAANHGHRRGEFGAYEDRLVDLCRELQFWESEKALHYWCSHIDALTGNDDGPPPSWSNRQAMSHSGIDGELHVHAIFDRVGGATFVEAWDRIDSELRLADDEAVAEHGTMPRTSAQRRADALVEMAIRATATDGGQRPRPLVTVATGDDSFRRVCELSNGVVVAPGELVPYLADADINTIVFSGPFHAVAASPTRSFTGVLRRVIEVRDRHCQHPAGDGDPINRCDVDHVRPWASGGTTCQCNGQLLERGRNRDTRRRSLTAADVTVWDDDPVVAAAHRRLEALCRRRRSQAP